MAGATVIPPGAGEVIGDTPRRRVAVVCEEDALHATSVRLAARCEGADLHVHRRHTDLFYVLDGELTVRLGPAGEPVAARAGMLARVPPLVVHGYRNASDAEVRFLNLHAPGCGFAAYLRALRDGRRHTFDQEPAPSDGGRPTPEASVTRGEPVVDRPGVRATMLADGQGVAVTDIALEPSAPAPAPPGDRGRFEAVYVLDGALDVTLPDRRVRADAGAWIIVPPGVAHAVEASVPVRYLSVGVGVAPPRGDRQCG